MDQAGLVDGWRDRRPVHPDAALTHEAVLALGDEARSVVDWVLAGEFPALPDATAAPRPVPLEPLDRYDETGRAVRPDGTWFEYLIWTREEIQRRVEYVQTGKRGKKLMQVADAGWERLAVTYCPIRYEPDPELAGLQREEHRRWIAARGFLAARLKGAALRAHVLEGSSQ